MAQTTDTERTKLLERAGKCDAIADTAVDTPEYLKWSGKADALRAQVEPVSRDDWDVIEAARDKALRSYGL